MQSSRLSFHDSETFSIFFTHTKLIIFRYIYGLHGGPLEEVEDLTSESYSRAWMRRMQFSGDEQDALRWLFTIARHLVIDAYRKKKNHLNDTLEILDDKNLEAIFLSPELSPEDQVARREQFAHLWELLLGLQFDRREMLVLRYILGWQVKQISEFFNMEENTVSVYIHRSLEQIRRNW
jgi:RNA polymerase sigma-70 factor (ECF subfamily)